MQKELGGKGFLVDDGPKRFIQKFGFDKTPHNNTLDKILVKYVRQLMIM
jgi:hypothetical protein